MASASTAFLLGLLHMRPFQLCLKARGFHPRPNPQKQIKFCCVVADFWGVVLEGHPAQGEWEGHQLDWHINCLELMAVFLALKYFLHQFRGCHVLVRVDNTSTVSCINHQGGLRSRNLNKIAKQIFLWAQDKFLSLRAVYIPGHLNVGADLLSRQTLPTGEWKPRGSETDLEKILQIGGGPLRLPSDSAMSPLLLSESPSPPGSGCDSAHMAHNAPVCVSSSFSAPGSSSQSSPTKVLPRHDSTMFAEQSVVPPRRLVMGSSGEEGPSVSGRGHDIPSQARPVESSYLAPDGHQLRNTGLLQDVIDTILSARSSSTRQSYASK